jgi:hypothetical protein
MSKMSSQGRRQLSTHYHDAARQHQEAAHLANKPFAPKEPRNAKKTRTSPGKPARGTNR